MVVVVLKVVDVTVVRRWSQWQTYWGGRYHNWIPPDQFNNLDDAAYAQLICDHVGRGEVQANPTNATPAPSSTHPTADTTQSIPPIAQVQVSQPPGTDTLSVLTGAPTTTPTNTQHCKYLPRLLGVKAKGS